MKTIPTTGGDTTAPATHRPGCDALGGYGQGVGPCSCGAIPASLQVVAYGFFSGHGNHFQEKVSPELQELAHGGNFVWAPLVRLSFAQAAIDGLQADLAKMTGRRDNLHNALHSERDRMDALVERLTRERDEARLVFKVVASELDVAQSEVTRLDALIQPVAARPDVEAIMGLADAYADAAQRGDDARSIAGKCSALRSALSQALQPADEARDAARWREIQPLLNFLQGVSPIECVNFGERHPRRQGLYWWRRIIDSVRGHDPAAMSPSSREGMKP